MENQSHMNDVIRLYESENEELRKKIEIISSQIINVKREIEWRISLINLAEKWKG